MGIDTGTPSRSPTPLGDPVPSSAAVPAEPPVASGSSTGGLFGSNAAPTGAFGSGGLFGKGSSGLFGKGTSSTTPIFGSSQSISNSPAPGPSLFGQNTGFKQPTGFGSLSSGNGQAAGASGTVPTPPPPGTGLFSNLASRPGGQPPSQPTGTSSLFGSTAPSTTKKSNTNTNKNNTDSGDRNNRGSGA